MQSRNECLHIEHVSTRNVSDGVHSSIFIIISSNFLSILIAFILVTNIVVIISIVRSMWTDRHMHMKLNISKILMTSMAVSDLFIACIPMTLTVHEVVNGHDYLGYYGCFFRILFHVFICTVSVYHVMFMAIDRYLAVCRPFTYRKLTRTSAYLMVVACWLVPACQMFLPMFLNLHIRGVETYNECARIKDVCLFKFNPIYHIVIGIMSINASLVITISLYAVVLRAAQQFHKRKLNFNAKFTKNLGIGCNNKSEHKNRDPKIIGKKTCIGSPQLSNSAQFQDLMSTVQPDKKVFSFSQRLRKLTTVAMHIFNISRIHVAMQELLSSTLERIIYVPKEGKEMDKKKERNIDDMALSPESFSISNLYHVSMNVQDHTSFCQSTCSSDRLPSTAVCENCLDSSECRRESCLTHARSRTNSGCSCEIFATIQHVTTSLPEQSKTSTQGDFKMVHKIEITEEIISQEIETVQSKHRVNQSNVNIYTIRSRSFDQSPMLYDISRVSSDPSLKSTETSQPDIECTQNKPDIECTQNKPDIECTQYKPDIECTQNKPDIECTKSTPDRKCTQCKKNVKHISKLHDAESAQKTPTKHNLKAVKTIGLVIICFVICWLPQGVSALISDTENILIPQWTDIIIDWLSYTNSALNPLVYCSNKSIRKTVLSLICPSRCRGRKLKKVKTLI